MISMRPASSQPPQQHSGLGREILAITILTLAGAIIRIWSLGRLGLVHFDEGIYALAGLWSISPRGLQSLDPSCIAYAPPGYPILVGLSYLWIGISDTSAILVSIICGTATIPLAAWLALRTFGRGAGAVTAALAAGSAAHVSFSRMALTDGPFLLAFLLAIGQGQRFLERPNAVRALSLGLCVGVAQLFKYNGWIAGMIVAAAAALGQMINRQRQSAGAIRATWAWGALAILLAATVYWPWFQFVESHGGYRSLLEHQRSYMNGITSWTDHWLLQLAQARVLSGSLRWQCSAGIAASLALWISASPFPGLHDRGLTRIIEAIGLASLCAVPNVGWCSPLGWIGFMAIRRIHSVSPAMLVLAVEWLTLSIMTPFYHPYARLWLPLHAAGWVVMGGLFVAIRTWLETAAQSSRERREFRLNPLLAFTLVCAAGLAITITAVMQSGSERPPSALEPTDSLRVASRAIAAALPSNVKELRLYCRPAIAFYLSMESRVSLRIQPSLDRLLAPASRASCCLVDTAMTRQEHTSLAGSSGMSEYWVVARSFPTQLSLPAILDVDPGSCLGRPIDRSAPLVLLRPRRLEEIR